MPSDCALSAAYDFVWMWVLHLRIGQFDCCNASLRQQYLVGVQFDFGVSLFFFAAVTDMSCAWVPLW